MTLFKWMLLYVANYPEVQNKLRQEIKSVIGTRMAVQEDRNQFHYLNAFISESMRFRTSAPIGLPHKTVANTEISNRDF